MLVKLDGVVVEVYRSDTDVYKLLGVPDDKELLYLYHSPGEGYVVPRDRPFWILDGDSFTIQDRQAELEYRPPRSALR